MTELTMAELHQLLEVEFKGALVMSNAWLKHLAERGYLNESGKLTESGHCALAGAIVGANRALGGFVGREKKGVLDG